MFVASSFHTQTYNRAPVYQRRNMNLKLIKGVCPSVYASKSYNEVKTVQSHIWLYHLLAFITQVKHNVGI